MFDIEIHLAQLPNRPGVYLMKDEAEQVIYVGKAKNLKKRVRQYFRRTADLMPKIKKMVSLVVSFEYIVTDSEVEALILELNLIKEYHPKYNTMLKDDKTYPYIKVTVNEAYPRIVFTREVKKDKAKYFGPYPSAGGAKAIIQLITKRWSLCPINKNKHPVNDRPCFNYYLKMCDGLCIDAINQDEHKQKIEEILAFLGGQYKRIMKELEQQMRQAADELDFEKAGQIRDQLFVLKNAMTEQKISHSQGIDRDIIGLIGSDNKALAQVFFIRQGKMMGREQCRLDNRQGADSETLVSAFIKQFYAGTPFIPHELVVQTKLEEKQVIEEWLTGKRGQKVTIQCPQRGEKKKLVDLAVRNAELSLKQFGDQLQRKEERTKGAVEEIRRAIGLDESIKRIEAYDISTISGVYTVGSMVVFEEGKPKRSDYRKFKIRGVTGVDDYASMEEMLLRRFQRALDEQQAILQKGGELSFGKFTRLPDLILMDGGKGQVKIAEQVLDRLGLTIPVCGMVKDDHHRTRGLYYQKQAYDLGVRSEGFKLITRIQDEAHRFAITYHRRLREKGQTESVLDRIKGIGPQRRKKLLKAFLSIENISQADVPTLMAKAGLPTGAAEAVYHFFHQE